MQLHGVADGEGMNKLFVLLGAKQTTSLKGWTLHADGQTTKVEVTFDELAKLDVSEIVGIAPSKLLSWHRVKFPEGIDVQKDKRVPALLKQAIDTESFIVSSIVHLAGAPQRSGKQLLVAQCDKDWLIKWTRAFADNDMELSRVVPEIPPEHLNGASYCLGQFGNTDMTSLYDELPVCVPLLPTTARYANETQVWASPEATAEAKHCFPNRSINLLTVQEHLAMLDSTKWNLLQHEFSSDWTTRTRRRIAAGLNNVAYSSDWKMARWGAAALIGIAIVGLNVGMLASKKSIADKQEFIESTAREAFPNLSIIIDPQRQMSREVAKLRAAAGVQVRGDFMPLIQDVGHAMERAQIKSRPDALSYSPNHMTLNGLEHGDGLRVANVLTAMGYQAAAEQTQVHIKSGY